MAETYKAIKVSEHVWWVGAIDWALRDFHGYATSRGSTYNAFLVKADKLTLIDTVKAPFKSEMLERIASVADPGEIDVIVSNHSEMDHSGLVGELAGELGVSTVYASKQGARALSEHHIIEDVTVVEDGQEIDLGGVHLAFYETRMCHWPDSMVSFLKEDKLLFSQDAFGMHLAGNERFADQIESSVLQYELTKYYANILMHLAPFISKALDKLGPLREQIEIVAPDHGPIYRNASDIDYVLDSYARWSAQEKTDKAVIVYDTMWQSTAKMARLVAEGLGEKDIAVRLMPLNGSHRSDVATEVLEAGALIVGSPTLNNNIFPTLADCMTYLKGLKPKNLIGAAFGSFGWSGEAPKLLTALLEEMDVDVVADPVRCRYVPTNEELASCRELGKTIGERLHAQLAEVK
ncbi:MAG: FprA family A-type flavoprotein [Planctomycetota bacterium]